MRGRQLSWLEELELRKIWDAWILHRGRMLDEAENLEEDAPFSRRYSAKNVSSCLFAAESVDEDV